MLSNDPSSLISRTTFVGGTYSSSAAAPPSAMVDDGAAPALGIENGGRTLVANAGFDEFKELLVAEPAANPKLKGNNFGASLVLVAENRPPAAADDFGASLVPVAENRPPAAADGFDASLVLVAENKPPAAADGFGESLVLVAENVLPPNDAANGDLGAAAAVADVVNEEAAFANGATEAIDDVLTPSKGNSCSIFFKCFS